MTTTRRVAITGAAGQLGRALIALDRDDWQVDALDRAAADLTDWRAVRDRVARFQPDLVIHAAAATDVDGCERDPALAYAVNALGTRHVARAAALVDAELVYVSTNYVFDGARPAPYHEFDRCNPVSIYGASKLAGEHEAQAATQRCYVVRTAWLYAAEGRNFVNTMRRLMATQPALRVVADQVGNPTCARDLAIAINDIVENAPYGVYHAVNGGVASWHDWAVEIAGIVGYDSGAIEAIPAASFQRLATPPANGALTTLALPGLGIELPDWRAALRECLGA